MASQKRDDAKDAFERRSGSKDQAGLTIEVIQIKRGVFDVCILGTSALFFNSMSEKNKRELLLPRRKRNKAELAASLKHDPLEEYRSSVYRTTGASFPTRLLYPAGAFKKAMSSAALDLPGSTKAEMGRLTWVEGVDIQDDVSIYGVPQIDLRVVRQAGVNHAPDVRTRAIVKRWACRLSVSYMQPMLNAKAVANLLAAAGYIRGIGDYRQEKGAGSFGQFELVAPTDPRFVEIVKTGGRVAQDRALEDPEPFTAETAKLLEWYHVEVRKRHDDNETKRTVTPKSADEAAQ